MVAARVEEELAIARRFDNHPRRFNVTFSDEERIPIHAVDLHPHILWPARAELRQWDTRVEEECSPRSGSGLSQLLGRQHPEREASIDDLGGEIFGGAYARSIISPNPTCSA
jgi:hypothetical protein